MKSFIAFAVFVMGISFIAVEEPNRVRVANKPVKVFSGRERRRARRKGIKLA